MIIQTLNFIFSLLFMVIGVLNALLVHPVPGIFYIVLAFVYLPVTDTMIEKRFNITIQPVLKMIIGIVVIWGTLAVGDLAELMGL